MKFNKLIIASVVAILSISNIAYAQNNNIKKNSFKDVKDGHWAKKSIEKITNAGVIKGYPDGTFKPDEPVTRAEFIRIVNGAMGYKEMVSTTSFKDVKKDGWYYSSLLIAEKYAYISGFEDGTFRPNEKITKEQVCVIVSKINNLKQMPNGPVPKDEISNWSKPYVNIVLSNRLMALDEKGNFYPKEYATRAIVADVLSNFVVENNQEKDKNQDLNKEETKKTKPQVNSGGSGGSGGLSGNSGNTVPNSPNTNNPSSDGKITQKEAMEKAQRVAEGLSAGLEGFETKEQKEIITDIISNLENYAKDSNYDYKSSVEKVREKYNNLSEKEKKDLKDKIVSYTNTKDLTDLKDKLL